MFANFSAIALIVVILLVVCSVVILLVGFVQAIIRLIKKQDPKKSKGNKRLLRALAGTLIGTVVWTLISQFATFTPAILGPDGKPIPGSIAELTKIRVNDSDQWLTLRGHKSDAPVILFLSGGPGGSQMANARKALDDLEKDFVMVQWDQPGSGKSYGAVPQDQLTLKRYIADGHAVTKYLKQRFNKQKIYLIGESWGSYLGIMLAKNYPQDYAAFIGSGQMVDFAQTEIDDYNLALKLARERGDTALVNKLEKRGTPPYTDGNVALDSMAYLGYIDSEMARNSAIHPFKSRLINSFMEPEFGLIDKYNCIIGFMNTFNSVYPQLYGKDLRKDVPALDVPVYFLLGRHDINAPLPLAEEYYNLLSSPKKELIWFEHSGHNPWNTEADRYMQEVRRIVAATQASTTSR